MIHPGLKILREKERGLTLSSARERMLAGVDVGIKCPCCKRYIKIYKRKLNSGMARFLVLLVAQYQRTPNWIDIKRIDVRGGDYGKLVHWGLVDHKENTNRKTKNSAYWIPTEKGIDFVCNRFMVPSHVHLLIGEVVGFSDTLVSIYDCLGEMFDYEELMKL